MKTTQTYICDNYQEVLASTVNLSNAHEVKLQMDDGGVIKPIDDWKGIYNSTQGEFCAAVTESYNVITHKTYFNGFAEVMDRLNIPFSMTIKEQNNQAFADIRFIGRNLKFEKLNEEFVTGIRLSNSYNKTQGLGVSPMFTRLACTNGMVLTRAEKSFSIRHHSRMAIEIEVFIEKRLNEIINRDQQLQHWVSESMSDSVEWKTLVKILEKLFTRPKHREEILKRLGITVVEKKKGKKIIGFEYVMENKDITKLNRWDVYNSVTQFATHGEHITPHLEMYLQSLAEKLLTTSFEKLPRIEVTV